MLDSRSSCSPQRSQLTTDATTNIAKTENCRRLRPRCTSNSGDRCSDWSSRDAFPGFLLCTVSLRSTRRRLVRSGNLVPGNLSFARFLTPRVYGRVQTFASAAKTATGSTSHSPGRTETTKASSRIPRASLVTTCCMSLSLPRGAFDYILTQREEEEEERDESNDE